MTSGDVTAQPLPAVDDDEIRRVAAVASGGAAGPPTEVVARRLDVPTLASATAGLWRVEGTVAGSAPWSAILKEIHHSAAGHERWLSAEDPADPYYWKREALFFASDLLPISADLRPERCYLIRERVDGAVGLWLEDVQGLPGTQWPVELYRLAARHLGETQGEFLAGRPLPDAPWLSQRWLRHYVERHGSDRHLLDDERVWRGDLTRPLQPLVADGRRLFDDQPPFLEALEERAPQTVCHLDFAPPNLFSGNGARRSRTVVIDWAFVGIAAAGEDAANLVADAMLDLFVDSRTGAAAFSDLVFDGYQEGVEASGWSGDLQLLRFAFAASMATKFAWILPGLARVAADEARLALLEQRSGMPAGEFFDRRAAVVRLLVELAAEARSLLREL